MNSKNFLWLGGGVAVFILLLAICVVAFGGISSKYVERTKSEKQTLSRKSEVYESQKNDIQSILSGNKVLSSLEPQWMSTIKEADADLLAAKSAIDKASKIVKEDDSDKEKELISTLDGCNASLNEAVMAMSALHEQAVRSKQFIDNKEVVVTKIKRNAASVSSSNIQSLVSGAIQDWPEKKPDLNRRISGLDSDISSLRKIANEIESKDPAEAISLANRANQLNSSIDEQVKAIKVLINQLYTSWDKMLVDMDYQESGWDMHFFHIYKIAKIQINPGNANKFSEETKRERVSEGYFDQHTKNLGMILASKPAGKYDHEIEKSIQTPLYNKVAPPGQNNHYGHWNNGSWHWNEFMMGMVVGNMFSGGNTIIRENDYHEYDRNRRSNRPYYGSTSNGQQMFGSQGATTKRTLGNAYQKTATISQTKSSAKQTLSTRHTKHQQSQAQARQSRSGWSSGGSRSGGGK